MSIKELRVWNGKICRITHWNAWDNKKQVAVGLLTITDNGSLSIHYPMMNGEVYCASEHFNANHHRVECSKVYRRTKEKWEIEKARFDLFLMESDFERYGTIHPDSLY